jgi:AraC family transcriptional regulator
MAEAGADRAVYEGRVNAAMDYVEAHLGDELTVETLAQVAHFSPFHFHRVFSAVTGETIGAFVARVRIERAATLLTARPDRPVTQIALETGFASPSSFSRAFRAAYGMSPTEWRTSGRDGYERRSRDPAADPTPAALAERGRFGVRGTRLSVETGRTLWDVSAGTLGSVTVRVEPLARTDVAYVRFSGRYQGLGEVFSELYRRLLTWAEPRGFVEPGTPLFNVYHDDPSLTDDDRLRVSVCIPVPPATPAEGDIGRMALAAGDVALGRFELGNDDYPEAWYAMAAGWLPDSGYEPDDRLPFERYVIGREARREGAEVMDIGIPVRPLRRY